jgi:hypothetical protein
MKKSQLYSLAGILLGWGAPLGALLLRSRAMVTGQSPADFVRMEWEANAFFYWYMLLGTCCVLALVGWLLGDLQDLKDEKDREKLGS